MKKILLLLPALLIAGCSKKNKTIEDSPTIVSAPIQVELGGGEMRSSRIPKATAFRMNGDYANHVAVNISSDGNLTYWPAPSDITNASHPISLGNGWYLNRQGFAPNAVFLKYTFDQYSALKDTPTPSEIKSAIIPNSSVTQFIQLPYNINEASRNIPEIKEFIKNAK